MTALTPPPHFAMRLLAAGVPLTLLIDLALVGRPEALLTLEPARTQ